MIAPMQRVRSALAGTALEPFVRSVYRRLRPRLVDVNDRRTAAIFRRVLSRDSSCVDVGAHAGLLLDEIVRLAPAGRHLAVEPIPALADELRRRFPTVDVHQVALSETSGSARFYHRLDQPGFSGLRRPEGVGSADIRELEVRTEPLDALLAPDRKVDLIKVDVEGAELRVLKGAERTLARWRPYVILEHARASGADAYAARPEDVFDLLRGFDLRVSTLPGWLGHRRCLDRADFVATFAAGAESYFVAHPPLPR